MKFRSGDLYLRDNGAIFMCLTPLKGIYVVKIDSEQSVRESDLQAATNYAEYLSTQICEELAYVGNIGDILTEVSHRQLPKYEELRERTNKNT